MDEARQRFLLELNRIVATQRPLSAALAALREKLPPLLGQETAHLFTRLGGEWQCRWSSDGREEETEWVTAVANRFAAPEGLRDWSDPARGEQFHPIPLLNDNKEIGCWLIVWPLTAAISPAHRFFHELTAGQINAMLQQHHADMQLRQRRRQLDLLYALSDATSLLRPLESTLANIHDQLNKSFAAAICLISLYDEASGVISFPYAVNYSERLSLTDLTVDDPDSVTAWVIRNNEPFTIKHWVDKLQRPAPGILVGEMPKILICYPMRLRDKVVGAISIQSQDPRAFNEEDEALLAAVTRQAAVAIQHARLYADTQRRLRDMSALVNMAKQITGDLQLGPVMETTVHILRELFCARACTIALLGYDGDELVVEAAAGIDPQWLGSARMRVGEGVSGQAVLTRELIYVPDTHTESDFLFFNPNLRSLLAVPLISRDMALGALTIDSETPDAFDESVIQLITIAAAQVSVAIANARLYAESEERAAQLSLANEELKAADQFKDNMVGNVSHELRNPLTFLMGYVDLLGSMGELNAAQKHALKVMAEKNQTIGKVGRRYYGLAKGSDGQFNHKAPLSWPISLKSMLPTTA
jgi:GAF domain-containing protein